jgi:hypothetical protein
VLFVGDDWAQDHHDVDLVDEAGRRLSTTRLPEEVEGIRRLHELTAAHLPEDAEPDPVVVGIETDRGPWVQALLAAGDQVNAVNPMQAARSRERHATSRAKSDQGDAHVLVELVHLDRDAHCPIAGDSDLVEATRGRRPRAPDPDLGPPPAPAAAAGGVAGVGSCALTGSGAAPASTCASTRWTPKVQTPHLARRGTRPGAAPGVARGQPVHPPVHPGGRRGPRGVPVPCWGAATAGASVDERRSP